MTLNTIGRTFGKLAPMFRTTVAAFEALAAAIEAFQCAPCPAAVMAFPSTGSRRGMRHGRPRYCRGAFARGTRATAK